jgi:FAD/FMN-containing dehydrogenase
MAALSSNLRGPVLRPGDEGFDEERVGYQTAFSHRPDVLVGAALPEDVKAAVAFAGEHDLPVAVQATGHGMPLPLDGGVLISTRRMSTVEVDVDRRSALIGAGASWQDVLDVTAPHGLAPLSGSAPHIGAVSYTLGGGLGLLAREHGYAADHVLAVDVVTADARRRHVTADSDPDLFWALLGGRGNFGVATGIEVELFGVAELYGGGLFFEVGLVPDIVDAYRRWTATVPDEMTSSIAVVPFPDAPSLPAPIRGRHAAHVRIAYNGAAAMGEQLVAPLRSVGPRLLDALGMVPYAKSGSIHNDPPVPMAYYSSNAQVRTLEEETISTVLRLAGPDTPIPCVIELRHLGGALGRPAANSVGHRDAGFLISVLTRLGQTDLDETRALHRKLSDAWDPVSIGTGLNFLYGENANVEQVRRAYDPEDYRRLAELKAQYDPTNIFRGTHNIPPAR